MQKGGKNVSGSQCYVVGRSHLASALIRKQNIIHIGFCSACD